MNRRSRSLVVGAVLVAVLAAGVWWRARGPGAPNTPGAAPSPAPAALENLSPAELEARLRSKDFLLVNVHVPYEGRIPGTDLEIPYDQLEQQASRLPQDRSAPIVLYCMSGRMSEIAGQTLIRMGYRNVSHLAGGMLAWNRAGLPLEDWARKSAAAP
ncbi:rhodanese-like domain-containing protein [Caldinitratiruptor microaerophilus]|uniref:Rhodanese domain-containing protein n=1 Tax=Caldinitratiruptor microaerophilus TaxID=671077 RepID=A0AA35CPB2_9FIRM|nr:rhodanese-like domain-containing protein [Caldinitratiruptor microaerophilus]BDG61195.1 hypothetical protein caldi_22850 [Caldinitratiruptor microaerophilus]